MKHLGLGVLACLMAAAAAHAAVENAIRLDGEGWTIRKVPVTDCRVVRGALGTPVDGSVLSWNYNGTVNEYPRWGGDGVGYSFNRNDGLHLTLADADGFDAVVLRGGAKARLYADAPGAPGLTEPQGVTPLAVFAGSPKGEKGRPVPGSVETVRFPSRVRQQKVVLFGVEGGAVADVSFYRVEKAADGRGTGILPVSGLPGRADGAAATGKMPVSHLQGTPILWKPAGEIALPPPAVPREAGSIALAMAERYGENDRRALALRPDVAAGEAVRVAKGQAVHFITPPVAAEMGLAAIELDMTVAGGDKPCVLTVAVQDPLDPRLDLMWIDLTLPGSAGATPGPGRVRLVLDVPDQVVLPGLQVWLTLRADRDVVLSGPTGGGAPEVRPHVVPRERAMPEALARRKFLLRTFFSLMSEPRPWGAYRRQSREEFFADGKYAGQARELFLTIDLCHALDPADDLVRQYREWVYRANLPLLKDVGPPPAPPAGVPPWAWAPRQAWLEARRIADWWLRERGVPTGEFGGHVGDDSDMYQQYADLPFFEDGGVGAALRDGAARMAELADRENLRGGLNTHSTDALHAYEEGINHLALMARWFYGDPIYLERCMDSARNIAALTVRTADGRRHFRDYENMGARDMETPRPPAVDGHATPMMWHAALQAADYNRNPQALALIREWADTWLKFQKPGQWATSIEVASGKVVEFEKDRPLYGGYRSQACVFMWLARLTDDAKYVEPLLHYARQGKAPLPIGELAGDLYNMGLLDGVDAAAREKLVPSNPALALLVKGDAQPLVRDVIGGPRPSDPGVATLMDARRWPDMYTTSHQFTDRVFPTVLEGASVAYLGGANRRNRFHPVQAAAWEGFGTDYAALVTVNRRDRFKAAVYSYADKPMQGRLRVWALDHGRYRLTVGPDADGDLAADAATERGGSPHPPRTETVELARAGAVELTLPPRAVTIVELRQTERLDPIHERADLALAAREIAAKDGVVTGVLHNIGAADVEDAVVAVVDAAGRALVRESLGRLPAPADLLPKRRPFTLRLPGPPQPGWRVVADPDGRVPEIYEGNNVAPLGPALAGWHGHAPLRDREPGEQAASRSRNGA